MTFDELWLKLQKVFDDQIYYLKVILGFSLSEIMDMEVRRGVEMIHRHQQDEYDKMMIDKIDMFSAHGVDVMKIEMYKDFINSKQNERFEKLEKDMIRKKKNKPMRIDPAIEKEIIKMQMDARKR